MRVQGETQADYPSHTEEGDDQGRSRCHVALTYRYHHGCLYAGDLRECPIDHQLHQFGTEKIGQAQPEKVERVGFSRDRCQQSAQAFRARDTK